MRLTAVLRMCGLSCVCLSSRASPAVAGDAQKVAQAQAQSWQSGAVLTYFRPLIAWELTTGARRPGTLQCSRPQGPRQASCASNPIQSNPLQPALRHRTGKAKHSTLKDPTISQRSSGPSNAANTLLSGQLALSRTALHRLPAPSRVSCLLDNQAPRPRF